MGSLLSDVVSAEREGALSSTEEAFSVTEHYESVFFLFAGALHTAEQTVGVTAAVRNARVFFRLLRFLISCRFFSALPVIYPVSFHDCIIFPAYVRFVIDN